MSLLLEAVVKSSLILLLALVALPLLRSRSAALRHSVLSTALMCAAIVPVVGRLVPAWHMPIGIHGAASTSAPTAITILESVVVPAGPDREAPAGAAARSSESSPVSLGALVRSIWLAGALSSIAVLLVGCARLRQLSSNSTRIDNGPWVEQADVIRREYGFTRPAILLQAHRWSLLVTWGIRQPRIILPPAAREWPEDRVSIVLAHELAHIRRGDWVALLTAELLRAIYWFNPLFWAVSAQLRQESEKACDDAVLNRGVAGSDYATHLVGIARDLRHEGHWLPAPAMTRTSSLERRVHAMLNAGLNRRPVSRAAGIATLAALLAATATIAAFAPAQGSFATLRGSIVDPMNAALPRVTLVLTSVQRESKYEVRSDPAGRYEFVGLPPGDYVLTAQLPGFSKYEGRLTIAGQDVQQDLALQVGLVEETITVAADPAPGSVDRQMQEARALYGKIEQARAVLELARYAEIVAKTDAAGCTPGLAGGNIRPPRKLKDVRPQYPSHLQSAGVSGTVLLEARIGTDGKVADVNVISTPHADLAGAAAEAVQQWQFDPTLLNCVPIDVRMKVTITFGKR
jgi:TonB family protein